MADAEKEPRTLPPWTRWIFAVVPLAGVVELAAHLKQAHGATPEQDWTAARAAVVAIAKPEDLVVFAPWWVDPVGREHFGKDVATLAREARPDETRFPRAIEVSIRGEHAPELATWKKVAEQRTGAITITTFENPSPVKLVDDLVLHANPQGMRVVRFDGSRETECPFVRGAPQTGNLGFGPAIPGDRFACPSGGFVGLSVLPDLDYRPHRCIYAPPQGGASVTRMIFKDVAFGSYLHGHHGIYVEAERNRDGAPVTLVFAAGGRTIGNLTHVDGEGWKGFELPTEGLQGTRGDLVAEVSAANGNRRMYCFEADTR